MMIPTLGQCIEKLSVGGGVCGMNFFHLHLSHQLDKPLDLIIYCFTINMVEIVEVLLQQVPSTFFHIFVTFIHFYQRVPQFLGRFAGAKSHSNIWTQSHGQIRKSSIIFFNNEHIIFSVFISRLLYFDIRFCRAFHHDLPRSSQDAAP
ncbi:hypothetical protein Hdeb2414_s0029g00707231 [Helianthus debilis subsp. tardiflorus]